MSQRNGGSVDSLTRLCRGRCPAGQRRGPTPAEALLWAHLRRNELGVRFRRQEPIGPFIADFVCTSARLVIELDGDSHDDLARDLQRDHWLQSNG